MELNVREEEWIILEKLFSFSFNKREIAREGKKNKQEHRIIPQLLWAWSLLMY